MKIIFLFVIVTSELYALINDSGILKKKYRNNWLSYYTIQSNIIVLIYHFLLLLNNIGITSLLFVENKIVQISVVLCIILTFLIYHFLLKKHIINDYKNGKSEYNHYSLINYLVHYICPILTFIYWLIFGSRVGLKPLDGIYWVVIPFAYLIFIFVRASLGFRFSKHTRFPYPFMDFDRYGIKKCTINLILITIIFLVLGILLAFVSSFI